jgi:hypothetical protein
MSPSSLLFLYLNELKVKKIVGDAFLPVKMNRKCAKFSEQLDHSSLPACHLSYLSNVIFQDHSNLRKS